MNTMENTKTVTITKRMADALREAWDYIDGALSSTPPPSLQGIEDAIEALGCKGGVPAELPAPFVGVTLAALAEAEWRCRKSAELNEAHGYHTAATYFAEASEAVGKAFRLLRAAPPRG